MNRISKVEATFLLCFYLDICNLQFTNLHFPYLAGRSVFGSGSATSSAAKSKTQMEQCSNSNEDVQNQVPSDTWFLSVTYLGITYQLFLTI